MISGTNMLFYDKKISDEITKNGQKFIKNFLRREKLKTIKNYKKN